MFYFSNLSVVVQDRNVIQNCSASFQLGQIHVIMGPNGSGKSSLAAALMGHPSYEITGGSITWQDKDITQMPPHLRAQQGIFLGLQNPLEIQGLSVFYFLKELCFLRDKKTTQTSELLSELEPLLQLVGLPRSILDRSVNVGFSGGEKKRFELVQMLVLRPKVVILDELDSGVDIDGLKDLSEGLLWYRSKYPDTIFILITHYRHILQKIQPDVVHVMVQGSLVARGDRTLLDDIEKHGYEAYAKGS